MSENTQNNFLGGMNRDALPSMSPPNTYRTAVNAQIEDFDYTNFGLVNEPSNELCFKIEEGFEIAGWGYIEERDSFVVFSYNKETKISQIGVGNTKSCTYKIVLEDKDPERFINKFCFSPSEKIVPQFKHLRPCNDLWMYWSNGFTYYRLNLDADLCDIRYEDIVLFDCKCPAVIEAFVIEEGSDLLDVGAYQFACQLIDDDENKTNWFQISNPVYLTSDDNKRGDKSDKAILIEIDNLPKSFPKVAIAAIKTVGGIKTAEVLTKLYHNGKKITYIYRGRDNDDEPIEISEILSRKTGFIQGKDLIQRDGRLFLYNLKEEWNLDAQSYVNKIETRFNAWKLPAKYAGETPTLPRGEVISLGAVFNYCDGTSSLGFHISGRRGNPDDFTVIPTDDPFNCSECEKKKWQLENTAFVEKDLCVRKTSELNYQSESGVRYKYNPPTTVYKKIDYELLQRCKNEIGSTTGHLTGANCSGSTPCSDGGDCAEGELCIDGGCCSGNCPTYGIPCSSCDVCSGRSADSCDPPPNVGADCDECGELGIITPTDLLKGLVSCPDGSECVDGYCNGTGKPCEFCSSCGGGDYYLKVNIGESYDPITDPPVDALEVDDCPPGDPIYDDTGCRIIGFKPSKVAVGRFGYWESSELYPKQKVCNGDYLYGELAGQPIRHHLVPGEELIPFHVSKNEGVVCDLNPDNYEWLNTDVVVIGLEFCNIELPPNPPKPYCPFNPISIYWQPVDQKDRRITARGLMTHTFLGQIGNRYYAVPKNGVNSLEYFDRHLNQQNSNNRGGTAHFNQTGQNSFTFHSPETQFQKIPLLADRLEVPFEITGKGKRYGIYAEGEEPINMWHTTTNQRGTRQAINLNKTIPTGISREVVVPSRCLQGMDLSICENPIDNIVNKRIQFTVEVGFNEKSISQYSIVVTNTSRAGERIIFTGSDQKNKWGGTLKALTDNFIEYDIIIVTKAGCFYRFKYQTFVHIDFLDSLDRWRCFDFKDIKSDNYQEAETKVTPGVIKRCINAISYAPKDSIVRSEGKFAYPLLNLKRESSVYLELDGDKMILANGIDPYLNDQRYKGIGGIPADSTSDGSFMGDVKCHTCPIENASSLYGVLVNESPNQYGRIESAAYIPLGFNITAEEIICKKAERYGIGDSYIGLHSFRRYSHVSDKLKHVANQFAPMEDPLRFLGIVIHKEDLLCTHDCTSIPEPCNPQINDPRGEIALRTFGSECWDGETRFSGAGLFGDYYHPHTQNTLVHFWTESRINLWKRQSGVADFYSFDFSKTYPTSKGAEVYYPRTKELALDPNFPLGTSWNKAWLSRIGVNWFTVAILKRWAINFLKLVQLMLFASTVIGLGFIMDSSTNRSVCTFLYKNFRVKQCRPKCRRGSEECFMDDAELLPLEDNYTGYNWDFTTQNTLETKIGVTDPYNTCICEVGEGNQIVYSQKQNPLSLTDAYKNFLPNSYLHIPASWGKIQSLFSWNNSFFAQTSDMIINIATADGIINLGNGQALEVITQGGDLRTNPKEIVSDVPEGYAGTKILMQQLILSMEDLVWTEKGRKYSNSLVVCLKKFPIRGSESS